MIDWHAGTWQPGDRVKYHDSRPPTYLDVAPGLYFYSGFGSGHLFRPNGTMLWCSPQEANAACRDLGIAMHYVDSFDHHHRTYVGD